MAKFAHGDEVGIKVNDLHVASGTVHKVSQDDIVFGNKLGEGWIAVVVDKVFH
jgi:hypothetical protein